jgi:ubiquinone/menaquinone biosynthesis C-methylase UbiE
MTAVTPEPILKVAMGFMAAKHLFVASEVGLFEALAAGPTTIEDLASQTGVPSRTIAIATAAMVSLGFIEQHGHHYQNGEQAAAFLAGKPGPDLRPMLRFFDQISYPAWQKLADAVRTGNGQAQFGKFDKRQQEIFSAGVESFSGPGAAALATNYDFGRHNKVLDVAGGTGSFLVAVLRRHAKLRGTLFELPGPCAVARQKLANLPEGSRIDIVEGDVFKDALPAGYDALIVANTAHVFSVPHNIELLRKMRTGVQPGARLLLVDLWTDPSHTQPGSAALISGEFLVISGEGQAYSEQEADTWLRQTGWKKIEKTPLAGPTSLIVAEAA